MSADILFADFHNKSKAYSKLKAGDLLPVIELSDEQVNALSVVNDLQATLADIPADYDPRAK